MSIDESLEDEDIPQTAQTTITSYCSSDVINSLNEAMNPLIEQGLKDIGTKQVSLIFYNMKFLLRGLVMSKTRPIIYFSFSCS